MSRALLVAESADSGSRLDMFISEELNQTRSQITKMIEHAAVKVNGAAVKSGYKLKQGDVIEIDILTAVSEIIPQDIKLDIVYEDDWLAVINKPQGMTVHPGGGCNTDTVANAVLFRYPQLANSLDAARPGIVHRLDKDTSGLMVIAKTAEAQALLSVQFADRKVEKEYLAVLEGNPKNESGEIKTLIGRDPKDRKLMCVVSREGREAITLYKVLERFKENSLVSFSILTGRTHQIRVHAKYLTHPVVGDKQYGYRKQRFNLEGQLLHAHKLSFFHPGLNQTVSFSVDPPQNFSRIIKILRNE